LKQLKANESRLLDDFVIFLIGNKIDCVPSVENFSLVRKFADSLAQEYGNSRIFTLFTSAQTGFGVEEFHLEVQRVISDRLLSGAAASTRERGSLDLQAPPAESGKWFFCC
jgi:GTPase SAR1 family protein